MRLASSFDPSHDQAVEAPHAPRRSRHPPRGDPPWCSCARLDSDSCSDRAQAASIARCGCRRYRNEASNFFFVVVCFVTSTVLLKFTVSSEVKLPVSSPLQPEVLRTYSMTNATATTVPPNSTMPTCFFPLYDRNNHKQINNHLEKKVTCLLLIAATVSALSQRAKSPKMISSLSRRHFRNVKVRESADSLMAVPHSLHGHHTVLLCLSFYLTDLWETFCLLPSGISYRLRGLVVSILHLLLATMSKTFSPSLSLSPSQTNKSLSKTHLLRLILLIEFG